VEVDIYLDGARRRVPTGQARVTALRSLLHVPADRWLSLHEEDFERFVAGAESLLVSAGARLTTCSPLTYRPSPKHKREPARGRKGSLCPGGVDGYSLLAQSYRLHVKPRRRWATEAGLAYCAMDDNAGAWHGYPVPMTDVPSPIWRSWLSSGKISARDLRAATIPTR